jgi:hypothetical protein
MPEAIRNYHDFHKVGPEELAEIHKIYERMIELGVVQKSQDSHNLQLDEEDQRYEYTKAFDDYMRKSWESLLWHVDVTTGKLKKFSNPKKMKEARRIQKQFEKMRRGWIDRGGDPDRWMEWYETMTMADIILEFKIINDVLRRVHENNPDMNEVNLSMEKVWPVVDKVRQKLHDEGNTEYEDMANLVYGWSRYKLESDTDRLLAKKMVSLEIMTDTGHLTTVFRDFIEQAVKHHKETLEEIARNKMALFAIVVEFTRDEDYDDPEAYFGKKTERELREYHEMARIVGRCILVDIVKAKEGME